MRNDAFAAGPGNDRAPETEGIRWRSLKEHVQRYLEREGVPLAQAERYSHEIVVLCAHDLEASDRDALDERALSEAETMLRGWQAARRETLLEGV
ncbi:hypothetical protein [Benzoatithermus flavus]|uniref:Uncharacterized protein n=1 Tax=Benzoatithermus flavus TaxID=3108223 RepID=A0ABU8XNS7_9PROT